VFSFVPRCHGLAASQKYTLMPASEATSRRPAISVPWSEVSVRRSPAGSWPKVRTRAT
jgi:hypothetical protein